MDVEPGGQPKTLTFPKRSTGVIVFYIHQYNSADIINIKFLMINIDVINVKCIHVESIVFWTFSSCEYIEGPKPDCIIFINLPFLHLAALYI